MNPERFQRVADLFREACQREPAARAVYLAQACGDHVAVDPRGIYAR